ncbi:MAG TPA: hypothetical protein VGL86_09845 [Polyangia bacterium]|jgi:hypothetical protein
MRRASIIVASLLLVACGCAHDTHKAPPSDNKEEAEGEKGVTAPPSTGVPTPVETPSGVQVAPTTVTPGGAVPKPLPPKIKIIVHSRGPDRGTAFVFWGRKKLGDTPVTLERPRDSGPVDLVVRSEGWFPVHTRAYTFHNDVVYVKMTKLENRQTIYGAKQDANEPPPGSTPDGGTPPPAPAPAQ